jgi:hypothetical protein
MSLDSAAPYISNDSFLLFANVHLIHKYSSDTATKMINDAHANSKRVICFVSTDLLFFYMSLLLSVPYPYVLITTCNDDFCVPYIHYPCQNNDIKNQTDKLLEYPNLIKWFTKNPCIAHPKLSAIPLGPKWQYESRLFFGEDKKPIINTLNKYCLTPQIYFKDKNLKIDLLYFNFEKTNYQSFIKSHQDIRGKLETMFLEKHFIKNKSCKFEKYLRDLITHKFCLCPPGRGVDTHRIWETLMVGTIPIMISSELDHLFEKLPVIILSDWSIITESYLIQKYEEIHNPQKIYDFSILYSDYWEKVFQQI